MDVSYCTAVLRAERVQAFESAFLVGKKSTEIYL